MSATAPKPPSPVSGIDVRSLPIGPQEAFVLSRVDGRATVQEIAFSTGLSAEEVEFCLLTLVRCGAIHHQGSVSAPPGALRAESARSSGVTLTDTTPRPVHAVCAPLSAVPTPTMPPAPAAPTTPLVSSTPPTPAAPTTPLVSSTPPAPAAPAAGLCTPPLYDPRELEEVVDLDLDRKRQILELFSQLTHLDHYELLGISKDADPQTLKSAYYRKVAIHHPDRYYGKNLGRFRARMEACFARLTEAYETLSSPTERLRYDDFLDMQRRALLLRRALCDNLSAEELTRIEEELTVPPPRMSSTAPGFCGPKPSPGAPAPKAPEQAPEVNFAPSTPPLSETITDPCSRAVGAPSRIPEPSPVTFVHTITQPSSRAVTDPGAADPLRAPRVPVIIEGTSTAARSPIGPRNTSPTADSGEPRALSDEERRRHLARKLHQSQASLRPPRPVDTLAPPIDPSYTKDHLRRHYDEHLRDSAHQRAHRELDRAEEALRRSDPMTAERVLSVVHSSFPPDPELSARLGEVERRTQNALSQTLAEQADAHERAGRFAEAARCFERAARGRGKPELWENAARCLLEAAGDLHQAGQFARKSIALSPERPVGHFLLGRVFLAAGMKTSAITELERARRLAPDDDTILVLLQRVQRGEV